MSRPDPIRKSSPDTKKNPLSTEEQLKQREFQDEAIVHINALYNYALHLTLNPHDANDLVQETYLKAYKFFGSFEKGTNCKAWLFKILKNNYINRYRKKRQRTGQG